MIGDIKPIARLVGSQQEYAAASKYVQGLDVLPLGRVVNDAKVTDHHAIIPTNAERHPVDKMDEDDRKIYDMVVRQFLAVFHPEAVFENTRVETTVQTHVFRTRGRLLVVPGWLGVYGETADLDDDAKDDDEGGEQRLPKLDQGEDAAVREVAAVRKETKPPHRYNDGSLLRAMETAGQLVDDEELREAMKESGIGTPATRAAIIERLLQVGYIERDGRTLVVTEKGLNVIRLLGEHALTSPGMTGEWEHRLANIEAGTDSREAFMGDIVKFAQATVAELDTKLKDVRIPRANLGPCPVCGHDIVENRKGYSCWSREDPGCGFVIWKSKAGKQLPIAVARELIKTGRTEKPVTGFKGRSGKSFRARLALSRARRASGGSSSTSRGPRRAPSRRRPRRRARRPGRSARRRRRRHRAVGAPRHTGAAMPLTLILGPANSAKAGEVLGAYAAAARRDALLVVPTAADAAHYDRELAGDGVLLGRCLTFSGPGRRDRAPRRLRGPALLGPSARPCAASRARGRSSSTHSRDSARDAGVPGCRRRADRRARAWARHARSGSPRRCASGPMSNPADPPTHAISLRCTSPTRVSSSGSGASTRSCSRGARSTRCARRPGAGARRRCSSTASMT